MPKEFTATVFVHNAQVALTEEVLRTALADIKKQKEAAEIQPGDYFTHNNVKYRRLFNTEDKVVFISDQIFAAVDEDGYLVRIDARNLAECVRIPPPTVFFAS